MIKIFKNTTLSTIIIFTILNHNDIKPCYYYMNFDDLEHSTASRFCNFLKSIEGKYCLKKIELDIETINFEKLIKKIVSLNKQEIEEINIFMTNLITYTSNYERITFFTNLHISLRKEYIKLRDSVRFLMIKALKQMAKIYTEDCIDIEYENIEYISYLYLELLPNLLDNLKQYLNLFLNC